MNATGVNITFDRFVATDSERTIEQSSVSVNLTPVIEAGEEKRWPQDEREPIVASYRGVDTLRWFEIGLEVPLWEHLATLKQPFEIDAWASNWISYSRHWSWRWPFYHAARHERDRLFPWYHHVFTARVDRAGLLVTVDAPRTVMMDDGYELAMPKGSGFYLTKKGPPE